MSRADDDRKFHSLIDDPRTRETATALFNVLDDMGSLTNPQMCFTALAVLLGGLARQTSDAEVVLTAVDVISRKVLDMDLAPGMLH